MDMKPAIFLLILVLLAGCKHDRDETCSGAVTITGSAPGCGGWGIVVDGVKYPSGNIPDSFKQDGMRPIRYLCGHAVLRLLWW